MSDCTGKLRTFLHSLDSEGICLAHYLEMDRAGNSSQESKLAHSDSMAMKNLVASNCPIAQGRVELSSTGWRMKEGIRLAHYLDMDRSGK